MFYEHLCEFYTPGNKILNPKQRMTDLSHCLYQRGPSMQEWRFQHPTFHRDMSSVFNNNLGRKIRSDAKGIVSAAMSTVADVTAAASSASRTMHAISSLKALRFTQQQKVAVATTSKHGK